MISAYLLPGEKRAGKAFQCFPCFLFVQLLVCADRFRNSGHFFPTDQIRSRAGCLEDDRDECISMQCLCDPVFPVTGCLLTCRTPYTQFLVYPLQGKQTVISHPPFLSITSPNILLPIFSCPLNPCVFLL